MSKPIQHVVSFAFDVGDFVMMRVYLWGGPLEHDQGRMAVMQVFSAHCMIDAPGAIPHVYYMCRTTQGPGALVQLAEHELVAAGIGTVLQSDTQEKPHAH